MKSKAKRQWTTKGMLVLSVQSTGRRLQIMCTPADDMFGQWAVIAAEITYTEGTVTQETVKQGIDHALENHTHHNLGVVRGMQAAIETAEKFVAWWQKQTRNGMSHEKCECVDPYEPSRGRELA